MTMLRQVAEAGGVSVCMQNGFPAVKAVASFVGPTNDADGALSGLQP